MTWVRPLSGGSIRFLGARCRLHQSVSTKGHPTRTRTARYRPVAMPKVSYYMGFYEGDTRPPDLESTEREREQLTTNVQDTEAASPENSSAVITTTPKNCKKGRKRSLNTCVSGVHDAIKQLKKISEENKQEPNEFDVFCESLAIQLKKMPLNRALMCQEKLQNVMTQERLFQLTSHPQSHPSMSSSSSNYQQSLPSHNSDQYSAMSSPGHTMHSQHSQQSQNHHYQYSGTDECCEETRYNFSNVLPQAVSSAGIIIDDGIPL